MSNVYTVDPTTIVFDDKYVVFNPLHNEMEYEATKTNIERLGQIEPILILNGKCVDGRHRTKIAIELGTMVRCIDLDPNMSEEDIVIRCNTNTMSGRDFDTAQKAIQALRLVNEYKITAQKAAKFMKVDSRNVSYASTIKGLGREDILSSLMEGKKIQLDSMERPSKSLEVICKHIKAEIENGKIIIDDSERIKFDPDTTIKTEKGKAWYYEQMNNLFDNNMVDLKLQVGMLLSEMANMKYKLKEEV